MKRHAGRPPWVDKNQRSGTVDVAISNAREVVNRLQGLFGPLLHPLDVTDVTMMSTAKDYKSSEIEDVKRYHKHIWYGECQKVNLDEIKLRATKYYNDGRVMCQKAEDEVMLARQCPTWLAWY